MSLKKKTIIGLVWSFISQGGRQLSRFVITAILAHTLSPNDFGLLAMAVVFSEFANIFGEMGISNALIQKQNTEDKHYYSAFWLNIVVGIILMFLMILVAPYIARFYNRPQLRPILMLISLNFVLLSFTLIQEAILTKEMNFKKLAIIDIIAVVLSGIAGIYLATAGYGVWSLIYQLLSFTLTKLILLWVLSNWRPKLIFSVAHVKDIFRFSANQTGFNTINYFSRNIDKLLIGKLLGSQALGLYSLAYKLMLYPLQNVSWAMNKVMFPAFSKMQDNLEKVRNGYKKMVKAISLVTFPMMLVLFAVTPEFVNFIYGPKWSPMIILIRILCICGIFQSIGTTVGTIFLSQGRPDIQFKLQFLGTTIVTLSVLFGIKWGINGVAFCYTLQSIAWVHLSFYIVTKLIKLKYRVFYSQLIVSYFISFAILFLILIIKNLLILSLPIKLGILIAVGLIAYFILLLAKKEIVYQNKKLFLAVLK